MKAFGYHRYGGPEAAEFLDLPTPDPAPGTLRVRVAASGLNPIDWKMRSGPFGPPVPLPRILGVEAAGIVEAVGAGVEGFASGDRVAGNTWFGSLAESTLIEARVAARVPEGIDLAVAATVPVAALTAVQALDELDLPSGSTLLVHAAAGGVGSYAVQLARLRGLGVIGTASAINHELLRTLGIDHAIDYRTEDFVSAAGNVDGVLETIGGENANRSLRLLNGRGRIVSVAGPIVGATPEQGGAFIHMDLPGSRLAEVFDYLVAGSVTPVVDEIFPFDRVAEAYARLETGHARGKIGVRLG